MDLFESQLRHTDSLPAVDSRSPLAVRMRPTTVEEVVGQSHLLAVGSPLRRLMEPSDGASVNSVILYGPAGVGKTTLAYLVARLGGRAFFEVSAVDSGVKEVRAVIDTAKRRLIDRSEETVLFVDEVHRFSKAQQDALLPAVENRWVTLLAATTENPSFSVISPLLSRSLLLTLEPLSESNLNEIIDRALSSERGLQGQFILAEDARHALVRIASGDVRRILTVLEAAANATQTARITVQDVTRAADTALIRYGKDEHYDVISAFIKSVRGSDVDAAIHYLARMLEAGEDPRYVARRLMISASEDVGLADPQALSTAVAAAQAVALVGMPEARIILAQATIAVASAPKSNAAYLAIDRAIADVRAGKAGVVPPHLRDQHSLGKGRLGANRDYIYAHDQPHAIAAQQYLPDTLVQARYYEPTERGHEALITSRLRKVRSLLKMS